MYSLFQPRDRQLGLAPAPLLLGRGRGRPALRLGGRGRQGGQGLLCQVSNKLKWIKHTVLNQYLDLFI